MNASKRNMNAPTKAIWLRFALLIPLVIVMAIASYAHIRSVCDTFEVWTIESIDGRSFDAYGVDDVEYGTPGVVQAVDVIHRETGSAGVVFKAVADGETDILFGDDKLSTHWHMQVRDGAIIEGYVNFSGWEAIHLCICLFLGVVTILFASVAVELQHQRWYGYALVASCGGLLFSLFQFALFTYLYVCGSLRYFGDLVYQVASMADYFVYLSLIPMGILALLVSISNIALVRHEGMRPVNLLGVIVSVFWLAANVFWLRWWYLAADWSISIEALQFVDSAVAVGITYGECLLLATILCAWNASRVVPRSNPDYLIVLGCGIRPDGTPSPLLAGRVDRALSLDAARVAAGDAPATFVPSGGQGPDEVMSEASSMRNYLMGKGVSAARIVPEDRSTTTRENMAFSRAIIEQHAGCDVSGVSVAFSTTNYHVFRGYVCAHEAGMFVQGMGSKTKAYFWPNAFLREFAGLLAKQWKGIAQTYLILVSGYVLAEYVMLMM